MNESCFSFVFNHNNKRSVWQRLYQTPTRSSFRHSISYCEKNAPVNDLDFRLRTCYDHAKETFASKARFVVQPETVCRIQHEFH